MSTPAISRRGPASTLNFTKMSSKSGIIAMIRTERTGSIFGRITGIIRSGNLRWEDRPLWFDAYVAHPPLQEPVWDIRMPKRGEPVPKIFYPEDRERAQKLFGHKKETGELPKHNLDEPFE